MSEYSDTKTDEIGVPMGADISPGHVLVKVQNLVTSLQFYRAIGLVEGEQADGLAAIELRGGTHILLIEQGSTYSFITESQYGQREEDTFDLMIRGKTRSALESYRNDMAAKGIEASEIPDELLYGHYWFSITDPDGHQITIYTSHEF